MNQFIIGLTIGYFWVTLLVMFTLYVFIYRVARALEKRSNANASKFVRPTIDLSKGPRRTPLPHSSSLSLRIKKKKRLDKRQTSIDDDVGSSFITNHHHHHRQSNLLSNDTNRSSSNENSAEHHPTVNHLPDNFPKLLTITRSRDGSKKAFEENRSLLPNLSDQTNFSQIKRQRSLLRTGTSSKARKALRTITVIMGAFVLCWTPVSISLDEFLFVT